MPGCNIFALCKCIISGMRKNIKQAALTCMLSMGVERDHICDCGITAAL